MSEFKIKSQNVRSTAQDMNHIAKQVKSLENQIWWIQNSLSFEIAQKENIRKRLKIARNDTAAQYKGLYSSTSALNNIVNTYEATERHLSGAKTPHFDMIKDTVLTNIQNAITLGSGNSNSFLGNVIPIIAPGGLIHKLIDGTSSAYIYEKYEEKDKNFSGSWKLDSLGGEGEKTFYSKNKDEIKNSKIEPFKILDYTWKDTKSVFHTGDIVGEKDGTHHSYNVDILKRKISAELYGGLYYIDSKTGQKKLRAATGAALGFSMTAFSMDTEKQLGDTNFGMYRKEEVAIGKVEAKATGSIGLRDAKGKLNPTLHGKVSAEAIAAEASIKGGVKIAGADIGVKASASVGIGAHAEVGMKDGKLSIDVGASFGIGGSVNLDIDIGGTVDAVKGAVKSVWNWFKK